MLRGRVSSESCVFARRLTIKTGYHSHHLEPIAEPHTASLRVVPTRAPQDESEKLDIIPTIMADDGRPHHAS